MQTEWAVPVPTNRQGKSSWHCADNDVKTNCGDTGVRKSTGIQWGEGGGGIQEVLRAHTNNRDNLFTKEILVIYLII